MDRELLLENYGKTILLSGVAPGFSTHIIPGAAYFHTQGPWGTLFLQEIETSKYLLRHFLFSLKQTISIFNSDDNKLQSLLMVTGAIDFEIRGQKKIELKKKEFLLFNTSGHGAITTIHRGSSSILNAQYSSNFYKNLIPYFTRLKADLRKAIGKPVFFIQSSKIARPSVHDAIKAIWEEKYIPALQAKHVELRLKTSLFTMIAQSYDAIPLTQISQYEKRLAEEAEKMILKDLKIHLTPKEIADKLNCGESWLRKTFRKVYGVPMFHYLRSARMHRAREQILRGVPSKAVSIDLGMDPSNFPKEFKAFFGYTILALKKGRY